MSQWNGTNDIESMCKTVVLVHLHWNKIQTVCKYPPLVIASTHSYWISVFCTRSSDFSWILCVEKWALQKTLLACYVGKLNENYFRYTKSSPSFIFGCNRCKKSFKTKVKNELNDVQELFDRNDKRKSFLKRRKTNKTSNSENESLKSFYLAMNIFYVKLQKKLLKNVDFYKHLPSRALNPTCMQLLCFFCILSVYLGEIDIGELPSNAERKKKK